MPKLYIGTSGWAYKEWGEFFFPKDLPQSDYLKYLAKHFNSVEINSTFYHLQPPTHFEKWRKAVPRDFRFAVKVSRFITHIKWLDDVEAPWKRFLENADPLKNKQGPFLFQFPSLFTGTEEEIRRIDRFLREAKKEKKRLAFEFRHKDCFSEAMLEVLTKYGAALVFANSSKYPTAPLVATADFVYFRLHGPRKIFASSYSDKELRDWAKMMTKFLKEGKDVFVYFNNDMHAHAPENARVLQKLMKIRGPAS